MSGFVAALRLNGAGPAPGPLLDAPLARLRHRGPQGIYRTESGPAALAQLMFRPGANGTSDILAPTGGAWQLRPDGPLLVGDLAILDGPQLAQAAGSRYRSDALAVLAAYDRWGVALGDHLEGEFAFVIWDPAARRLLALRDRFGIKPLAYRATADLLLIASEPAALDDGVAAPDPRWIAGFLSGEEHDAALSPFPGVRRLAPGHRLACDGTSVWEDAWWQIETATLPEAEAPEALAEALDRAVRARMTRDSTTLLSGGLDSSTITCLAARASDRPVRALSMRYAEMPELDEGRYIDAVRNCGNILGVDAQTRIGTAFEGMDRVLAEQGFPVFAPNQTMLAQTHRAAVGIGAGVVLDGHGGDEVIGNGTWYFGELAHERRWRTLWRALRANAAVSETPSSPRSQMIAALAHHGPRPVRPLMRRMLGQSAAGQTPMQLMPPQPLAPGYTDTAPFGPVALRHDHLDPFTRYHARIVQNPSTALAFEFLDRAATHAGLDLRFPFYDRHVIAITLGQPTRAKIAPGQPRDLLRKAMAGVLPEIVRRREGKTDFTPGIVTGFTAAQRARLDSLAHAVPELLAPYLDPGSLRGVIDAFDKEDTRPRAVAPLMRLLWLDTWLHSRTGAEMPAPRKALS
ncbi:asparagine synthase-related protein [Salipiger abyssi]|uniref:asparagine synthase-related protein n=1 Tax=Salipiger abyssi TaxID=1250539 RepID=UPI001A8CC7BF|nr:asparagine synthase-related protein [Salipiger abyssi]MBN9886281.1 hypothetical protein [Salipiger abyssi]